MANLKGAKVTPQKRRVLLSNMVQGRATQIMVPVAIPVVDRRRMRRHRLESASAAKSGIVMSDLVSFAMSGLDRVVIQNSSGPSLRLQRGPAFLALMALRELVEATNRSQAEDRQLRSVELHWTTGSHLELSWEIARTASGDVRLEIAQDVRQLLADGGVRLVIRSTSSEYRAIVRIPLETGRA